MGGGHYTAHAMNHRDGNWYNFNDSSAFPGRASDAVSRAAYVLFYRRRGGKLLAKLRALSSIPSAEEGEAERAAAASEPDAQGGGGGGEHSTFSSSTSHYTQSY